MELEANENIVLLSNMCLMSRKSLEGESVFSVKWCGSMKDVLQAGGASAVSAALSARVVFITLPDRRLLMITSLSSAGTLLGLLTKAPDTLKAKVTQIGLFLSACDP